MTILIAKPHLREPWGNPGDERVFVHCRLDEMRGTSGSEEEKRLRRPQYEQAKRAGDMTAAVSLVQRCANDAVIDLIVDALLKGAGEPTIVFPHPSFDDEDADGAKSVQQRRPSNAIPFAFGNYLGQVLGCTVNVSIVQAARSSRTKLGLFPRFLWQPRFVGDVIPGAPYILADDVVTSGGTLAALRTHILQGGGVVIAATSLSHKDGTHQKFAIRPETLSSLGVKYGTGFSPYWLETIGHVPGCLCEPEGQFLIRWDAEGSTGDERLLSLRTRLAEAAARGE